MTFDPVMRDLDRHLKEQADQQYYDERVGEYLDEQWTLYDIVVWRKEGGTTWGWSIVERKDPKVRYMDGDDDYQTVGQAAADAEVKAEKSWAEDFTE